MRIMAKLALLALAARACYPEERQDSKRSITVYVDSRAEVTHERLSDAEFMASRMFAQAGVFVRWHSGPSKRHEKEQTITFAITSNTPQKFHPGALAYAEVYVGQFKGAHIRIFFDRVESSATILPRSSPFAYKLVPILLAHLLVHEITHILQNSDHHSEGGVMKKQWTMNDLYQMSYRPLPFDPFDVELIHRGLANRDRAAMSARLENRGVAELAAAQ
jgi:hypothetical protein